MNPNMMAPGAMTRMPSHSGPSGVTPQQPVNQMPPHMQQKQGQTAAHLQYYYVIVANN